MIARGVPMVEDVTAGSAERRSPEHDGDGRLGPPGAPPITIGNAWR
jgi:hypothetical protein